MDQLKEFLDDIELFLIPHKLDESIRRPRMNMSLNFDTSNYTYGVSIVEQYWENDKQIVYRTRIRPRARRGVLQDRTVEFYQLLDKMDKNKNWENCDYDVETDNMKFTFHDREELLKFLKLINI